MKIISSFIIFLALGLVSMAQQNDINAAEFGVTNNAIVENTFKSTKVINSNSTEMVPVKNLEFRIAHRFGNLDQGFANYFGLINATSRLSLEYGNTKSVSAGVGISPMESMNDGYIKVVLMRQKGELNKINSSFSIVYFGNIVIDSRKKSFPGFSYDFIDRFSSCNQLIISKKLTSKISFQLSPTIIHLNMVPTVNDNNIMGSLGLMGRYKITNRLAFNFEYYFNSPTNNKLKNNIYENSFAIGFDIDTGRHIFELCLTNINSMVENYYIPFTKSDKKTVNLKFGFNINRQFVLGKKHLG